jgi:hypothetical protein
MGRLRQNKPPASERKSTGQMYRVRYDPTRFCQVPGTLSDAQLYQAMGDTEELRARASRLFAFALSARELGIEGYATALTKLANDALAEAEDIERRANRHELR